MADRTMADVPKTTSAQQAMPVTLDEEAAQHLGDLLAHYQAHWPQGHWTAAKLLSSLVTDAWRHQLQEPRRLGF